MYDNLITTLLYTRMNLVHGKVSSPPMLKKWNIYK